MKLNPFLNATAAVAYIGAVALFMRFIESLRHDTPDTILDGVGFISLFVFSAAVMAFLFFLSTAAPAYGKQEGRSTFIFSQDPRNLRCDNGDSARIYKPSVDTEKPAEAGFSVCALCWPSRARTVVDQALLGPFDFLLAYQTTHLEQTQRVGVKTFIA